MHIYAANKTICTNNSLDTYPPHPPPKKKKKKKTVSGLENGVDDFLLLWSGVGNIYQPCFVVVILKVTNC